MCLLNQSSEPPTPTSLADKDSLNDKFNSLLLHKEVSNSLSYIRST